MRGTEKMTRSAGLLKVRIHWKKGLFEYSDVLEGADIEELLRKVKFLKEVRGLDSIGNEMWSEELKESPRADGGDGK